MKALRIAFQNPLRCGLHLKMSPVTEARIIRSADQVGQHGRKKRSVNQPGELLLKSNEKLEPARHPEEQSWNCRNQISRRPDLPGQENDCSGPQARPAKQGARRKLLRP